MSKTKENLLAAFTGESTARNRYIYYAEIARKEGYGYIAKILEEVADNEKYHALEELKLLLRERTTIQNLTEAIEGERYESEEMYPRFSQEAEVEGERSAEILFTQISKIEKEHRARFKKLLDMVQSGTVFKREQAY